MAEFVQHHHGILQRNDVSPVGILLSHDLFTVLSDMYLQSVRKLILTNLPFELSRPSVAWPLLVPAFFVRVKGDEGKGSQTIGPVQGLHCEALLVRFASLKPSLVLGSVHGLGFLAMHS